MPFHSLESMKETKKENSTNQFALGHEGLGNKMYTLCTVKKKKKEMTSSYTKNLSITWHKRFYRISILQISNFLIYGYLRIQEILVLTKSSIFTYVHVWSWGDNLHFKHPAHFGGKSLSLSLDYILTSSTLMQKKKKKNTGERGSRRNNKQWRPILLKEKHENFIIIDSQFVLEPTIDTRNFAASFMLISSLADVSNHLRNPLSLQYSSIWLALFTKPSFAWSHCQTQKKDHVTGKRGLDQVKNSYSNRLILKMT